MKADITQARRYFKAPFRYDSDASCIFEAGGNMMVDVRAWGYLTGRGSGAHGLSDEEAIKIQDAIGHHLVGLLNTTWDEVPKFRVAT